MNDFNFNFCIGYQEPVGIDMGETEYDKPIRTKQCLTSGKTTQSTTLKKWRTILVRRTLTATRKVFSLPGLKTLTLVN